MGCGSSGNVVPAQESNGHAANGKSNGAGHHDDDLPTVVLPDTPAPAKPPIAFEIPLEEFDAARRQNSPPPHLQRLLQPPQPDISLPDIEEKLAEAELRRQTILQQRAASAQKRAQKMMKSFNEVDRLQTEHEQTIDHTESSLEPGRVETIETNKHAGNAVHIPPEPGVHEDKNIY